MNHPVIISMTRISSYVCRLRYLILLPTTTMANVHCNLETTSLSYDTSLCSNRVIPIPAVVNGIPNVTQDTEGNILLGGIRKEAIIWLPNITAIYLPNCLSVHLAILSTSLIARTSMSNSIMSTPNIGDRDFSGVWAVRPMLHANAIICHSFQPIFVVR